ncbi:MAG: UPF0149 family protein [Burkholderiaceae bacterium]
MQKLTPADLSTLTRFLTGVDRPDGTLSYPALEGFLFAVVCSPADVRPADWLPLVFAGDSAHYANQKQSDQIIDLIVRLYSSLLDAFMDEVDELPDDCAILAPAMANFDDEAPLAQWARGFELGHEWLGPHWEAAIPAESFDEAVGAAATLGFFASSEQANAMLQDPDEAPDRDELAHVASAVIAMLPDALNRYAGVRRRIEDEAEDQDRQSEAFSAAQIGAIQSDRSGGLDVADEQPCPCGSGKSYRRCCGSRLQ